MYRWSQFELIFKFKFSADDKFEFPKTGKLCVLMLLFDSSPKLSFHLNHLKIGLLSNQISFMWITIVNTQTAITIIFGRHMDNVVLFFRKYFNVIQNKNIVLLFYSLFFNIFAQDNFFNLLLKIFYFNFMSMLYV